MEDGTLSEAHPVPPLALCTISLPAAAPKVSSTHLPPERDCGGLIHVSGQRPRRQARTQLSRHEPRVC